MKVEPIVSTPVEPVASVSQDAVSSAEPVPSPIPDALPDHAPEQPIAEESVEQRASANPEPEAYVAANVETATSVEPVAMQTASTIQATAIALAPPVTDAAHCSA